MKHLLFFLSTLTMMVNSMADSTQSQKKEDLLKKLNPEQYAVTQKCSTEPPFKNAYWNHHEPGIYVDIVDNKPLFSSTDKFDSGSGWPSFTRPIDESVVDFKEDKTAGMARTEVKSKNAQSHLGHVFDDGPGPDHKRYCINSASLRFIHARDLEKEGFEKYLKLFPKFQKAKKKESSSMNQSKNPATEEIILAGGCFWGVQDLIRKIDGVTDTKVGYSGGNFKNPKYNDMKTGTTGHAEVVKVVYDTSRVSFDELLDQFFDLHDPTTLNRQGNDIGSQYRSEIFYQTEKQKEIALKKIKEWNESKRWSSSIVTRVTPASEFYLAEKEHQDYLVHNKDGYTCHFYRNLKAPHDENAKK